MNKEKNNNGCGCDCHPQPAPVPPVDINMSACDRNINMLPMLQTYTTKVLKPNIDGCCKKNILKQCMMNCENYKYVIKWDFDLNDQTITVPKNCILEFDGGSLKNGTIIGQDTVYINVGDVDIWGENLTREGTWREHSGGGGSEQIQSDWNQTNNTQPDFIKNKPQIPEGDRPYNPSEFVGMGKKFIPKNIVDGRNILTQGAINQEHMIYVLQYDFDLDGEDINVPNDCIIEFDGGSVNDGTFRFNAATVIGDPKGTALFGVAYKDGAPLLQNYKRDNKMSQVYDFAYYGCYPGSFVSSVCNEPSNAQAICVTADYIFVIGNKVTNEDWGIITLFDRNFNYLGQCGSEAVGHGNGCTVIDDKMYFTPTWKTIGYHNISDIVQACYDSKRTGQLVELSNTYIEIPELGSDTNITGYNAIDYDPVREEVALLFKKPASYTDYNHCYLAILDKEFHLKKKFTVDLNEYVENNFVGGVNVGSMQDYKGTFGDIAYRHGVVMAVFWISYGETTHTTELAAVVEIDANTSIPIAFNSKFEDNGPQTEPEGICVDPDNDSVFWFTSGTQYEYSTINHERTPSIWIGRMSFSEELNSVAVSWVNNPRNNVYSMGSIKPIYVDNNYTGISTGNRYSPFKTLETALLLNSGVNRTVFHVKPSNTPYAIGIFSIGSDVTIRRWNQDDDPEHPETRSTILHGARLHVTANGSLHLENITLIGNKNRQSALCSIEGGYIDAKGVIFATDFIESITQAGLFVGIDLYDNARLSLAGNCSILGFHKCMRFHTGSCLTNIDSLTVRYADLVYSFETAAKMAEGAISALDMDNTVTKAYEVIGNISGLAITEFIPTELTTLPAIEQYAKDVMTKCMQNPNIVKFKSNGSTNIPYGEYMYTSSGLRKFTDNVEWFNSYVNSSFDGHENLLLGTGNISMIDNSGQSVYDRKEWRKMGTRNLPAATSVSVANESRITGGVSFTAANQGVCKDVLLKSKKGWCIFSALVKGTGSISIRIVIPYTDGGSSAEKQKDMTYSIDSTDWQSISLAIIIPDGFNPSNPAIVYFYSDSVTDVVCAAPKLEMSSTPTQWTPNEKDYPKGGATANRPTNVPIGYTYYDTEIEDLYVHIGNNVWTKVGSSYHYETLNMTFDRDYTYNNYFVTEYEVSGWSVGDIIKATQTNKGNDDDTQLLFYNKKSILMNSGVAEGVVPEETTKVLIQLFDTRSYDNNKTSTLTAEKKVSDSD